MLCRSITGSAVLILILLEVTQIIETILADGTKEVLILILLEVTQIPYNGVRRTMVRVLILILLEVTQIYPKTFVRRDL